jgi:hypothetical protein
MIVNDSCQQNDNFFAYVINTKLMKYIHWQFASVIKFSRKFLIYVRSHRVMWAKFDFGWLLRIRPNWPVCTASRVCHLSNVAGRNNAYLSLQTWKHIVMLIIQFHATRRHARLENLMWRCRTNQSHEKLVNRWWYLPLSFTNTIKYLVGKENTSLQCGSDYEINWTGSALRTNITGHFSPYVLSLLSSLLSLFSFS